MCRFPELTLRCTFWAIWWRAWWPPQLVNIIVEFPDLIPGGFKPNQLNGWDLHLCVKLRVWLPAATMTNSLFDTPSTLPFQHMQTSLVGWQGIGGHWPSTEEYLSRKRSTSRCCSACSHRDPFCLYPLLGSSWFIPFVCIVQLQQSNGSWSNNEELSIYAYTFNTGLTTIKLKNCALNIEGQATMRCYFSWSSSYNSLQEYAIN